MSTVKEYTTSASLEEHVQNMVALLAEGDGHFLIGGAISPFGIKPVTFTRNISDEFREMLTKATPIIVANIVGATPNQSGEIQ